MLLCRVRVGHATVIEGDDVRTGVTAIIPGPGNLYTHPVPAGIHVGNGYGKLIGETQVRELGEIETALYQHPDVSESAAIAVARRPGFGNSLRTAAVITPSVPSAPINICFRS